jgi:hypothetical protein
MPKLPAAKLSARVHAAFPDVPPADFPIVLHHCDECARVEHDFRGKRWPEVDLDTLRYHYDSLPLLSPEAFRYYLPSFILGAITDPESNLPDFTLYSLLPGGRRREKCRFSDQQEHVIVEFARWVAQSPESERIEAYWSKMERA